MKNTEGLQQAALAEYGADLHVALRSRKDELLYLRKLTELLFPYVMPPKATDCRYISHSHNVHNVSKVWGLHVLGRIYLIRNVVETALE